MIRETLRGAHWLDETLKRRIGKPYHVILGIGLVVSIAGQVRQVVSAPTSQAGWLRAIVVVVFALLLLVNQLGELSDRFERRRLGP